MKFEPLSGSDARLITLEVIEDQRGSFARVWCQRTFIEAGIELIPVQANSSLTRGPGAVRGMHFQRAPMAESKLVRCTLGRMYDVVVDLRPDSADCGKAFAVELSGAIDQMLYVPRGFAHGFQTLSEEVRVEYLMGAYYDPALYSGFRYDDPAVSIAWPLPAVQVSARDLAWPPLELSSRTLEAVL